MFSYTVLNIYLLENIVCIYQVQCTLCPLEWSIAQILNSLKHIYTVYHSTGVKNAMKLVLKFTSDITAFFKNLFLMH